MNKNGKTDAATGARILPDLTQPATPVVWHALADGMSMRVEGDFALLRFPITPSAIEAARPSKSGALCMVAGGNRWHKADKIPGMPEGAKLNASLGVPNPAHDKAAAKRATLLAQLKAAGITAADLA
jgi:hypothetical protein